MSGAVISSDAQPAPESTAPFDRLPTAPLHLVLWRMVVVWCIFMWFGTRRLIGYVVGGMDGPTAARLAFERLGPTYIKLGQLIASGEAVFPDRYSEAFRTLLDRVPPFPYEEVERVLQEELGEKKSRITKIDATPLAAASIAQVHTAQLEDGTDIVIKIQRPGIAPRASADVTILHALARWAEWLSPTVRRANAVAIVEDFSINLAMELDFRNEMRRMQEFNAVMKQMANVNVTAPHVYEELSGKCLLTMERFRGWRIDDVESVRASPFDPEERLIMGIRAWFQTLICKGFFHGDVHAGNFLLLQDGRVGFLDFGIVGQIDAGQRQAILEYVLGFQQRDFDRVTEAMLAMGVTNSDKVDRDALSRDMEATFAPMIDPVEGFRLRDLLPDLIRTAAKHGLKLPRDLVLVTKQLVYLDRYSRAYGGEKMNVLTDARLTNLIMQDMFASMFN